TQPPAAAPTPVPAQAQTVPTPPPAVPVAQPPAPPPAAPSPAAQPAAPPAVAAAPQAPVEPPARGGGRFQWPTSGPIVSDFGPKPDGLHNDGINIGAEKGAPVIAAENGVVAYSGNELRGYGNLLLVRHADGWVTAYAHLDQMLVERGARVKRGEKIGTVGQSGGVTAPQLHFEVRKGSRAVDPRDFLEKGGKRLSSANAPGDRQGPG
ncbi:MAG TPA: M23 family metallopeptidase, partial [Acetobacteraceae bacterium]